MTTEWKQDPPPSPSTSMLVGCFKAGVGEVGDTSQCNNECDPPPMVEVKLSGSIDVNVTIQGFS